MTAMSAMTRDDGDFSLMFGCKEVTGERSFRGQTKG
jgi:hypothetical protein